MYVIMLHICHKLNATCLFLEIKFILLFPDAGRLSDSMDFKMKCKQQFENDEAISKQLLRQPQP